MKFVITNESAGKLLRDYLYVDVQLSRRLIKKVKAHPTGLLVNSEAQTVRYVLQVGDIVRVTFPPEEISPSLISEALDLQVMYEDEWMLVVNKPSGMPTMPSHLHPSGTLANAILGYYTKEKIPYTIHIVTRLDKDTSGLVLVAKHHFSHSLFSNLQRDNQLQRTYEAFVTGEIELQKGTVDLPIARKPGSIIERIVAADGQRAVTHYEVIEMNDGFTRVKVQLETGRTHQIRVHFAYLGHPLIGDDLYGGNWDKLSRQALHCQSLRFVHPFTNEYLTFTVPLAEDMKKIARLQ